MAAVTQIEASRQAVQIAVGEYYPSINLSVNYYLSKQSIPTNNEWNLLVDAVQPLFEAGLIRADVRTALSQLRQAKLNESLTRRQVDQQVLTAYENLAANGARLKELAVAVNAAREALRVARGCTSSGTACSSTCWWRRTSSCPPSCRWPSEEFNRRIFYLDLLRVTGKLGRPPGELITTAPSTQAVAPVIGPLTLPDRNETLPSMDLPARPNRAGRRSRPSRRRSRCRRPGPSPRTLWEASEASAPRRFRSPGRRVATTEPVRLPPPDVRPDVKPLRLPAPLPTTRPLGVGGGS